MYMLTVYVYAKGTYAVIAFTKSYCFKIHSQNTSRVYQLVNVYGLI